MALVLHWYDLVCFALVAVALIASLWVIKENEGGRRRDELSKYESLLIAAAAPPPPYDCEGGVGHRSGHVGSTQLWMTCWRGVHPLWLLGLRLVSFLTLAWILSVDIQSYDSTIMLYYTEWTFALVIFYFAIATLISAHGCWIYSKQCSAENEEADGFLKVDFEENSSASLTFKANNKKDSVKLQSHHELEVNAKRAGFWGYLMQVVYQTSAGAVMLTDVVFWGLLVPFLSLERFRLNLIMGCMNSVNAVFLLLDSALNSLPFPWFRMAYFVLWSCIYVFFQWVLHACGFSWWPYPFLELDTPWAPLWYFCMALIHIPCYGLYYLILKAKNSYFPKFFPGAFIRSY